MKVLLVFTFFLAVASTKERMKRKVVVLGAVVEVLIQPSARTFLLVIILVIYL